MFDLVHEDAVARLTLNRPEARNAIPQDQWKVLAEVLGGVAGSGARVLIVESHSREQFCAGADFNDLERLRNDLAAQRAMLSGMRGALDTLAALPIPTIAAIDGGCFGAGVALALACDLRIAGHGAQFAIPPARLGITYPHEDIARLVGLVGWGHASHMLFAAARIGAEDAGRIGLAEIVTSSAWQEANAIALGIARNAPGATALLKRSIALARAGETRSDAMDRAFEAAFDGPEFAEGMAALREGRAPEFGR